jgi:hypothetical protein
VKLGEAVEPLEAPVGLVVAGVVAPEHGEVPGPAAHAWECSGDDDGLDSMGGGSNWVPLVQNLISGYCSCTI